MLKAYTNRVAANSEVSGPLDSLELGDRHPRAYQARRHPGVRQKALNMLKNRWPWKFDEMEPGTCSSGCHATAQSQAGHAAETNRRFLRVALYTFTHLAESDLGMLLPPVLQSGLRCAKVVNDLKTGSSATWHNLRLLEPTLRLRGYSRLMQKSSILAGPRQSFQVADGVHPISCHINYKCISLRKPPSQSYGVPRLNRLASGLTARGHINRYGPGMGMPGTREVVLSESSPLH